MTRGWLLLGALAIAGYFLLPSDGLAAGLYYDGIGAVSSVVMVLATRLRRPAHPAMWYLFAGGQLTWVVGDLTYSYYEFGLHQQPFPSAADAFYLAAYPVLTAGLVIMTRPRGDRRDWARLLDPAIVATGVGLVLWTLLMRPVLLDHTTPGLNKTIAVAYPAFDLLMLAVTARALTQRGARTASYRLVIAAVLLLMGSDVGFALLTTFSSYTGGLIDLGWLAAYVLWAAAALHPSAARPPAAEPAVPEVKAQVLRFTVLTLTALSFPALVLVEAVHGGGRIDGAGLGLGGTLLFGLVFARAAAQATAMRRLALRDEVTGLGNRRLLQQRLAAPAAGARQLALIDLDDFKVVNDRLGHAAGDELLVALAHRLQAGLPAATVVRLGGDEFAALLHEADEEAAAARLTGVLQTLQQPVRVGGAERTELTVRASAGLASGHGDLLRRADIAMYAAKGDGGGLRCYTRELDEAVNAAERLSSALREAFTAGRFHLVYQPIVTLPTGDLVGVEALVRWPDSGGIGPAEFIPAAERSGLIVELGEWILREACRQGAEWIRRLGPDAPGRISVNVSPRQLREPDFAVRLAAVLAETGLPAGTLVVEVTETAVFDSELALRTLRDVHGMGVRIALDDFGTGHSSLTLLQTCPADILKVDKSFIDDVTQEGRPAVIATALIGVAQGLGLTAVAEGVETHQQADHLFRLGYQLAQGYLFGRPATAGELTARLSHPATPVADRLPQIG
jgi:diguanylate cyclase